MEINAYTVFTCKYSRDLYSQINLFLLRTVHIKWLDIGTGAALGGHYQILDKGAPSRRSVPMVDKEVIIIKQWDERMVVHEKEHIKRKVAEGDGCWIVA